VSDLLAKFLPRFLKLSQERLGKIEAQLAAETPVSSVIVNELHAIAGEAGLIGLPDLANVAREGERTAKSGWSAETIARIADLAAELRRQLTALEKSPPTSA
jgi:HPt (histidine-containing phosphotransfer) domain-containing protein